MMEIFEQAAFLRQQNTPFVIATVIETSGSAPGKSGFKLLLDAQQQVSGTVGGGAIEKKTIEQCREFLGRPETQIKKYLLHRAADTGNLPEDTEAVPMMCNGGMTILYESFGAMPAVYIFGGGHVGQALSFFLFRLGYYITVIDNRSEFATPEKHVHAQKVICSDYHPFCSRLENPAESYAVIVTHGHQHDQEILQILLKRELPFKYIGIIASRSKAAGMLKQVRSELGEKTDLSAVYTPIGLDIGGNSESEISLSIAAEIQAVRYGKAGPHLKDNR
ncbi:MAG: XdhC/CoxI family protein [Calditrichia bacterium]